VINPPATANFLRATTQRKNAKQNPNRINRPNQQKGTARLQFGQRHGSSYIYSSNFLDILITHMIVYFMNMYLAPPVPGTSSGSNRK